MEDIDRLTGTVEAFCLFLEELPEDTLIDQEWGPREVLSHLVYYHESYAAQIQAILSGNSFEPPKGRFRDLNAQAVSAFRGIPITELTARLREADQHIRTLIRERNPREISFQIKKNSKHWTLAELIPAIESHIRNHQKELRKKYKKEISE
jgi:hypothetical protein